MKYRTLGRTGAQVSELIFACGETPGMMSGDDIETMTKIVDRAIKAGINWFDTAARAAAIELFDPGPGWSKVSPQASAPSP